MYDNIDRLEETLTGSGASHKVNGIDDNIDRLEETLTGSGAIHRVNGIAVKKRVSLDHYLKTQNRKFRRRNEEALKAYISGQRPRPPVLHTNRFESVEEKTERIISSKKYFLWITSRIRKNVEHTVPGFVKLECVSKTVVWISSKMLVRAIKIKEKLQLSGIRLVCDQDIEIA